MMRRILTEDLGEEVGKVEWKSAWGFGQSAP
jgi:hypothetical protein